MTSNKDWIMMNIQNATASIRLLKKEMVTMDAVTKARAVKTIANMEGQKILLNRDLAKAQ